MTWGSNATFQKMPCIWCGADQIDDRDEWPTTHMMRCPKRPRFGRWGKLSAMFHREVAPARDQEKETP
jgi:hypothetical protein